MTLRARRAMICTAGLAAALVAALTAVRRGYLRDHIEAWRFQLARATETIEPAAEGALRLWYPTEGHKLLHVASHRLHRAVIFDPDDMPRVESRVVFDGEPCMKALLEKKGWRVFEQRFPRRAFVCIRSDDPPEDPGEYLPFLRSSSEATP